MARALIEKNIVVISGTGTGQSSFLNNVALMLRFANFEEAIRGARDFVPAIPVNTRWNNIFIVEGQDENVRRNQASSRTLIPQIYRVKCDNVVFNFIDTPGMSDSGGQKKDEEHLKHISTCIGEFKDIHGILLLLKSSDSTLNDSSKYTFNMLLSCFGRAAGKIISFGITHAGHNKNAGDAPTVIRKYVQDLKYNSEIDCSKNNLYCFESDPLYHVLSTKSGGNTIAREEYSWSFENNVEELHRLLTKVVNRNDSYIASNIQTFILARHMHPDLACLVPFIDRTYEEYKYEVNLKVQEILAEDTNIYEQWSNLMKVRRWKEPFEVTRTRFVDQTKNVIKERIVKEEYMEEVVDIERRVIHERDIGGGIAVGAVAGAAACAFLGPLGMAVGGIFGGVFGGSAAREHDRVIHRKVTREVPKTRDKVEKYVEKVTVSVPETYFVTEYRDREAYEEDPEVKRSISRIEDERTKLKNELSSISRLYKRLKVEKEMVLRLLCDITLYLKEHAMVSIGHSGHSGASMDLNSWIEELKRKGHWKLSDSSPTLQEQMTRLRAMENYEHFGKEIEKIITKHEMFVHVQYRVVDIPIEENNPFLKNVLEANEN